MQKLFEFDEHLGDWRVLVQSRDIQNGAIQGRHIAPGAIDSNKLSPDIILGTEKIADKGIDGRNIADGAVTRDKIADEAVEGRNIAEGAVTRDKIADEAVEELNAFYEEMRGELEDELQEGLDERYTKEEVNNIISRTPQTDVVVLDVPEGSTAADVLDEVPVADRPNKLFRVRNDSNTHYDEHGWTGEVWALLASKDYGIDDDMDDESTNLVTNMAVSKHFNGNKEIRGREGFSVVDENGNIVLSFIDAVFRFLGSVDISSALNINGSLNINGAISIEAQEDGRGYVYIADKNNNIVLAIGSDIIFPEGIPVNEKPGILEYNDDKLGILRSVARNGINTSNRLQLLVTTDTHLFPEKWARVLCAADDMDSVIGTIHLGDMMSTHTSELEKSAEVWNGHYYKPRFVVMGNHDVGETSTCIERCNSDRKLYDTFFPSMIPFLREGEYQDGKLYWYHDFNDTHPKVKLIALFPFDDGCAIDDETWAPVDYDAEADLIEDNHTYHRGDKVNVVGYTEHSFVCNVNEVTAEPIVYLVENYKRPRYKALRGNMWFGQEQLEWFADQLISAAQNEQTVIVAQHFPAFGEDIFVTDESVFHDDIFVNNSYPAVYDQRYFDNEGYDERDLIPRIVNAYMCRQPFSAHLKAQTKDQVFRTRYDAPPGSTRIYTLTDNCEDIPEFDFECDFSVLDEPTPKVKPSKVIFISGHYHSDLVLRHKDYDECGIAFMCGFVENNSSKDIMRSENDKTADSPTSFTVLSDGVHLCRLGADMAYKTTGNRIASKGNIFVNYNKPGSSSSSSDEL